MPTLETTVTEVTVGLWGRDVSPLPAPRAVSRDSLRLPPLLALPPPLTLSEAHVSAGCPWWLRASPQLTLLELPSHGAHTFRSLASWPSVGPGVRESF